MLKGRKLEFGDRVGLIAPSSPVECGKVERSIKALEDLGFSVVVGRSCYGRHGYLAGHDEVRAWDINDMFKDDSVKGIFCIRGGYGSARILNMIDYDSIKKNPKVFVGYSDITALHMAFNNICNMVTFHGPMVDSNMADGFDEFSKNSLLRTIMDERPIGLIENPDGEEIKTLVEGYCEGKIVGGNLTLIASTLGTPYEIDIEGNILFIEDIDEEPYRVDRMLTQLLLSGKLDKTSGIIIGDFNNCNPKNIEKSLSLEEVFVDVFKKINKPTIMNLKVGHLSRMITLPLGGPMVQLDATNKQVNILDGAVSG